MKKNKSTFETNYWYGKELENPFEVIDAFFDYAYLDYYKQGLAEAVLYMHKQEVYKKEYHGQLFVFYARLHSFVKACFYLQYKGKKWQVRQSSVGKSILYQGALTKTEFANPLTVFQSAFAAKSLDEFDFFLCEVVHIALSPSVVEFDSDLLTPYIHLIKMLDASQLMRERGLEKIKKKKQP